MSKRTARDTWSWGGAAARLPGGRYALPKGMAKETAEAAALGWAMGCYRFDRYKQAAQPTPQLVLPGSVDKKSVAEMAASLYLVRDLINTPASDMGPARTGRRGDGAGQGIQGEDQGRDRRRAVEAELSDGACGRARLGAGTAADRPVLGQGVQPEGHLGWQGRVFRFRRPRPETLRRDAADEKGYGAGLPMCWALPG